MSNSVEKFFNGVSKLSSMYDDVNAQKDLSKLSNEDKGHLGKLHKFDELEDKASINEDEPEKSDNLFYDSKDILPENQQFADMLGKNILIVMAGTQMNILGQTFRPMFTGKVVKVTNGFLTLDPVIIKISTAPFYKFSTPLSFPMERITYFVPFDPNTVFSIP